jgi:hypothetical protein
MAALEGVKQFCRLMKLCGIVTAFCLGLPAIAAQIAKELRAQYVISYYPSNTRHDGSFRSVRVTVNNRKLIAQTRQGCYAPDDRKEPQGAGYKRQLF